MDSRDSPEIDDELFEEVYGKAYTGPPTSVTNNVLEKGSNKRPVVNEQSDDDDELIRDPNAIPTDFTSREAKFWEAKSKATERNWKKRKEEEMICKICGEAGHFTQGCPSTLGTNRKSADFFQRVPARDAHIRSLFSSKVIRRIENDVGCKIKMDEKFLFVSGKDRLVMVKGVDAVHEVIQMERKGKGSDSSSSLKKVPRPTNQTPVSKIWQSESERNGTRIQHKSNRHERTVEDKFLEDTSKLLRGVPQAFNYDGEKCRPMRLRSPQKPSFVRDAYTSYDGHKQNSEVHTSSRSPQKSTFSKDASSSYVGRARKSELHSSSRSPHKTTFSKNVYSSYDGQERKGEVHTSGNQGAEKQQSLDVHSVLSSCPQTLEELEMKFKSELMELGRVCDKEENDETYMHRECIQDMRKNYMKRLAAMRGMQVKQWEKFLQVDFQRQQQPPHHNGYDQSSNLGYAPSGNSEYAGISLQIDSRTSIGSHEELQERALGILASVLPRIKMEPVDIPTELGKSPDLCMKVSPVHAKPSASKMDVSCKAIVNEGATGMLASVLPRIKMELVDIPIESERLDNNIQPIETHVEEMAQLVTPSGLQWKGKLEILDVDYDGIQAHFPGTMAQKAYNALRRLPKRLKVELLPRVTIWPKSFDMDGPCYQDFAFYLSPDDNVRQKYICLLNDVTCQDLGMRCSRNGADLLFFSSEKLPLDSQRKDGELYLWGLFCSKKRKGPADIPPGFSRPH